LTRQNEEARRQLQEAAKPLMSVGDSWKREPQGGKKMSYEEEVPRPPPTQIEFPHLEDTHPGRMKSLIFFELFFFFFSRAPVNEF
jgi:hypothetical protein